MQIFTISNAVREARNQKGWTQTRLADAADLDSSTISRIENGHTPNPGSETLGQIAKALEVPIGQLTGEQTVLETSPDTLAELTNVLKYRPNLAQQALKIFVSYTHAAEGDRLWIERLLNVLVEHGQIELADDAEPDEPADGDARQFTRDMRERFRERRTSTT